METTNSDDDDTIEVEIEVVSSSSSCASLNVKEPRDAPNSISIEQFQQSAMEEQLTQEKIEESMLSTTNEGSNRDTVPDKRDVELLETSVNNNLTFVSRALDCNSLDENQEPGRQDEQRDTSYENDKNNSNSKATCAGPLDPLSGIQSMAEPTEPQENKTISNCQQVQLVVQSNNGLGLNENLLGPGNSLIDVTKVDARDQLDISSTNGRPEEKLIQSEAIELNTVGATGEDSKDERIPIDLELDQEDTKNKSSSNHSDTNETLEKEIIAESSEACGVPRQLQDVAMATTTIASDQVATHGELKDLNEASRLGEVDLDLVGTNVTNANQHLGSIDSVSDPIQVVSGETAQATDQQVQPETLARLTDLRLNGKVDELLRLEEGSPDCELVVTPASASNGWTLVRESLARMADGWLLIDESEALEIEPVSLIEPSRCLEGLSRGNSKPQGSSTVELISDQQLQNGQELRLEGKLPEPEQLTGIATKVLSSDTEVGTEDRVGYELEQISNVAADISINNQLIDHEHGPKSPATQQQIVGMDTIDAVSEIPPVASDSSSSNEPISSASVGHHHKPRSSVDIDIKLIGPQAPLSLDINLPARRQRLSFSEDDNLEREFDEEPEFERRQIILKRNLNPRDEYELGEELGKGRFGTVFKCTQLASGRGFAAKFIHMRRQEDRQDVEREVKIMSLLQHKRLLQLFDAFDDGQHEMCLITELVDGGELFERIVDDDFDLTEKKAAIFMRQICEGVDYMHSHNIVHLDMKPENILCLSKTGNRIKLIDFGLARQLDPNEPLRVMFGTPEFAAPEVLAYETVSLATDMWSVGVICYVLLSGLSPFMGDSDMETMANVLRTTYDFDSQAFDPISDLARDFIAKLLLREPTRRLKPNECLQHPWLQRGGAQLEAAVRERRESAAAILAHRQALDHLILAAAQALGSGPQSQKMAHQQPLANSKSSANSSADTTVSLVSLDKRNLKRYVVRRKWHKTVHAIMALGRMGANFKPKL